MPVLVDPDLLEDGLVAGGNDLGTKTFELRLGLGLLGMDLGEERVVLGAEPLVKPPDPRVMWVRIPPRARV